MQESMINRAVSNKAPLEGEITKKFEHVTAQIPSIAYLGLAAGSMVFSIALAFSREKKGWANFVGLWVPSFLLLGIYNKIVKTEGTDKRDSLH